MRADRGLFRSIVHTFVTIALAQGAQILAGIATARAFGPPGKGVISFAGILIAFALAAAEGLRSAIAFQIGNEGFAAAAVWRVARRIALVVGPIGSALFFTFWLRDRSQLAYLYVAATFSFAFYLQTANVVYLIRDRLEQINVQNALTIGAGNALVVIVAVLAFHASVAAVLAITFLSYVVNATWAAVRIRSLLPDGRGIPSRPIVREQIAFGWKGGLSAIVTLLAVRIDVIIVGTLGDPYRLGIYATAVAVAELLLNASKSVTWATTGKIATLDRPASVALTAKTVRSLVAAMALAALAMALVGPRAISLVYGHRFDASAPLFLLMLPRNVLYSADGVISYFINVRQGRVGVQFAFELATLVATALATGVGIWRYGLTGAAVAGTCTFALAFCAKLIYFARSTGTPAGAFVPRRDDIPSRVRSLLRRNS